MFFWGNIKIESPTFSFFNEKEGFNLKGIFNNFATINNVYYQDGTSLFSDNYLKISNLICKNFQTFNLLNNYIETINTTAISLNNIHFVLSKNNPSESDWTSFNELSVYSNVSNAIATQWLIPINDNLTIQSCSITLSDPSETIDWNYSLKSFSSIFIPEYRTGCGTGVSVWDYNFSCDLFAILKLEGEKKVDGENIPFSLDFFIEKTLYDGCVYYSFNNYLTIRYTGKYFNVYNSASNIGVFYNVTLTWLSLDIKGASDDL
jgi:hypothetical protein